jgi:hypothetical protein
MNNLYSLLIGALAAVLVFASGYESGKTAERERMNEVITQEQIKHAKSLAEATNAISVASREYDAVRSERDVLSRRLLDATRRSPEADTLGTCQRRVTDLESMVTDLHGMVEKCDAGWNGCARRKDALVEAVK